MPDKISMKLNGVAKLQTKLKRITPAVEKELRLLTAEGAEAVRKEVIKAIRAPKHGKWAGTLWRRSAPGEAPAAATGKLLNYISTKKANRKDKPGARLIAAVRYAAWLEYGTKKMAARPFMGPAVRAYKQKFKDMLDDGVRRVLGVEIRK